MDDILASIRRIIADDDALPLSRSARAAAPQPPVRPAIQATSPATPPPPVGSSADALLGLGQRLFRGGEAAAAAETTSVSTFRPPAPRAAAAPDPLKAPMLKLRDFAPSEPLGLRPSLGEPAKNPERAKSAEPVKAPESAKSAEPVKAPEPAKNMASAKTVSPQTSAPPANSAKPAENVEPVNAPEIKAAEPAKAPDSPSASVANLAEARLKVSPLPVRVAAAPQPEEPRPAPAPKSSEAVSSAPAPSAPVNETAAEKPLEPPSFRSTSRRISAPPPASTPVPAQDSEPRSSESALLSPASGARVGASFEALAESLMLRDPQMLDRVAREMLRPMLKTWLDDNLPIVVERLVRAEIERIARGRG
jgi:cell pole-organizing protein PopZ